MKKRIKREQCDNCGVHLEKDANYCHKCGQENHVPNQPIKHLLLELFESIFHFDTKFFYSSKNLILRPGLMTKEFNANKRARYVPPIRLYIFVSALFFLVLNMTTLKQVEENFDDLGSDVSMSYDSSSFQIFNVNISNQDSLKLLQKMNKNELDSFFISKHPGEDPSWLKKAIFSQSIKLLNLQGSFIKNILRLAIKYTSIMLFFLMPFLAFILWLIFWKRKKNYYEYLIFSVQYHTVCFALLILAFIVGYFVDSNLVVFITLFLLLLYLYKSIRFNYAVSRIRGIFYSGAIFFTYGFTLLLSVAFAFLLGVLNG